MMKLVRQEAEKAKASVRSVRHKALEAVKKEFRAADDRKRVEKEALRQGGNRLWLGEGQGYFKCLIQSFRHEAAGGECDKNLLMRKED
eukprot:785343-Pelagomonas_calceolata.AAC.2